MQPQVTTPNHLLTRKQAAAYQVQIDKINDRIAQKDSKLFSLTRQLERRGQSAEVTKQSFAQAGPILLGAGVIALGLIFRRRAAA